MGTVAATLMASTDNQRQAIAQGLRRRDPETLDDLIDRHQHRLMRYLIHLTRRREAAEEVFQETWLRVLERGRQYDGRASFATWLFTIARNLVIDHARKKKALSLEDLGESARPGPAWEMAHTSQDSPFDAAAGREQAEHLGSAVLQLPAVYREVMVLRFQEDLKLEEIARVVDAPLSTVKARLYRGLAALRDVLGGERR
jgi:RNA polymerase sigma-70 factor (ECF subfamily)